MHIDYTFFLSEGKKRKKYISWQLKSMHDGNFLVFIGALLSIVYQIKDCIKNLSKISTVSNATQENTKNNVQVYCKMAKNNKICQRRDVNLQQKLATDSLTLKNSSWIHNPINCSLTFVSNIYKNLQQKN